MSGARNTGRNLGTCLCAHLACLLLRVDLQYRPTVDRGVQEAISHIDALGPDHHLPTSTNKLECSPRSRLDRHCRAMDSMDTESVMTSRMQGVH